MADRYWMKMTIGGNVSVDVHKELMEVVDDTGFENVEQEEDGNLEMDDCELTWSSFTDIKEFCHKHLLPYTIQCEAKYGEDGFLEWWQPGMEESRSCDCDAAGQQVFTMTQLVDANAEIETIKRFLEDNVIPELPPFCVQGQEESETDEEAAEDDMPCPHYQDNQGFCHKCGILMDEGAARDSGYWQEGMVEGK